VRVRAGDRGIRLLLVAAARSTAQTRGEERFRRGRWPCGARRLWRPRPHRSARRAFASHPPAPLALASPRSALGRRSTTRPAPAWPAAALGHCPPRAATRVRVEIRDVHRLWSSLTSTARPRADVRLSRVESPGLLQLRQLFFDERKVGRVSGLGQCDATWRERRGGDANCRLQTLRSGLAAELLEAGSQRR